MGGVWNEVKAVFSDTKHCIFNYKNIHILRGVRVLSISIDERLYRRVKTEDYHHGRRKEGNHGSH